MSTTLVTRGEYSQCVKARKCAAADVPPFVQTDNDPVVGVSWDDAQTYVTWLRQTTGKPYRLPSEAEWEYAARAGTRTARYWGDWGDDFVDGRDTVPRDRKSTVPVKSFRPNQFNLHDMLGHVWQWTEDCWNDSYAGNLPAYETARITTGDCGRRVLRGGSWSDYFPRFVRAGIRVWSGTGDRYTYSGFRVARIYLSP